ncbi:hypothetical protein BSKO_01881 [Bryopsis sp. KO-2023]|nr:hypothetical protein BSKO_01881 [Bryopsis sp. KO-2023]
MMLPIKVFFISCACVALAAPTRTKPLLRGGEGLGLSIGNGGRKLSQKPSDLPETKCFWDEVKGACLISQETTTGILDQIADSDMKTMASNVAECNYTPTADECAEKEMCDWGNSTLVCEYKFDHTDEENFNNCIGENVVFIEMSPAFKICKTETPNRDGCNLSPTCTWDETLATCEFDVWKFMTGVPAQSLTEPFPKGVQELVESRAEEISSQLKAEALTDGDEILAFQPTPFVCPVGVDMVLCTIAEIADHLTIMQEYCDSKRSGDGTCDSDEFVFCSPQCLPSEETLKAVREEQTSVSLLCKDGSMFCAELISTPTIAFLALIKDPTSKKILEQQSKCLLQGEIDCNKDESCFFDTDQEVCDVKPSLVLRHLSKHPVNRQNPHCEIVQPVFNSGCMEHKESKCAERPNCIWDIEDGPFALIRGMLEDMPGHEDLKLKAAEADEYCYEIKNKGDCV